MKNIYAMEKSILLLLLALSSFSLKAQTADTLANQTTQCILSYIAGLPFQSANKVLSGQWMHHRGLPETPQSEFDTSITSIYNQTSKWVGIIGTDYMRELVWPNYQITNHASVNQPLINYFRQGGLVCVMVSLKNPWNGGNSNNLNNAANLLDVITPGNPANTQFVKDLDSVALGLQQLQDSGVTVIFRPFHEQNGGWFWWGLRQTAPVVPTAVDFATVWQYTFNYFTATKQLHNIIWMFSPSVVETGNSFAPELYYYPGNNYVDIIGLDEYNDTLDISTTAYAALLATGKPLGYGEFGPKKTTVTNNPFVYDYTILINQIKAKYPALSFFLAWNHFATNAGNTWVYYSLSTQSNTDSLLNDSWVVTRDEVDYSGCLSTSISEQTISELSAFLFPNPFTKETTLQTDRILSNATLTVYNCFGQTVKQIKNISGQTVTLHRDNLPSGLYFIHLTQDHKEIIATKLIVTD
ncbi:MAG: T9SS type A sorting domain-containing protein [Bacteroidia bacterium]|nr:T9SS type A sorting domain-containing protein [Bacteroidia bacterium]